MGDTVEFPDFDPSVPIAHETNLGETNLSAIGLLMVTGAVVEIALSFQILRTISNEDKARVFALPLVVGQEISVKLGILRTFLAHRVRDREPFEYSVSRLQKLFDRRHLFAHGTTVIGRTKDELCVREFKFVGEKKMPAENRYFTKDQVVRYAREMVYRCNHIDVELSALGIKPFTELNVEEFLPPTPPLGPAPAPPGT